MSMPQELKAQLAAEIGRTPSPTREQLTRRTLLAVTLGVASVLVFALRHGPSAGARAPIFMAAITLILVMFAGRTFMASISSTLWTRPGNARRLAVMPYVALAAVALAYARGPALPHSLRGDMHCAESTLLFAAVVGGAMIIARRGIEPLRPTLKGFLLGSFAATVAAALVFLVCPLEEARHFAIGHLGGALVAFGLLGGIASRVIKA